MTLLDWQRFIEDALGKAGFENAAQEAKWLLAGALGQENAYVILNPTVVPTPDEEVIIQEWLRRRLKKEPLSRIKGMREFWSLPFQLNAATLDPRPETETIVEGVLKWVGPQKNKPWRILDLGTGSGCLLISLLHELPSAVGVGVDLQPEALEMAQSNAALNGVETRASFSQGNWGENLEGSFDIIVSNPPYISLSEEETLEDGVRLFDPSLALFGGEDGLACYRALAESIPPLLSPDGVVFLEIGQGQRPTVEALFHAAGFQTLTILSDLAGIERTLSLARHPFA